MGLEVSPQYIQDLNASWPLGTESQRQGDDHLRNIKHVLVKQLGSLGAADLTATAEELNALASDASWESAWPIGAIYLTMGSHDPNDFLPGIWGQIAAGRFLVGVGSDPGGQVSPYTLGSTGGDAEHTLTEAEMPRHDHDIKVLKDATIEGIGNRVNAGGTGGHIGIVQEAGSSQPHENRPPYIACAVWQRLS